MKGTVGILLLLGGSDSTGKSNNYEVLPFECARNVKTSYKIGILLCFDSLLTDILGLSVLKNQSEK